MPRWQPIRCCAHKHVYLNVPFFLLRAAVYFAGWMLLSWFFNRWSAEQDRDGGRAAQRKMGALAGPGLIFWGFSVTFMAVDWVLSLDPHWFSTMFACCSWPARRSPRWPS